MPPRKLRIAGALTVLSAHGHISEQDLPVLPQAQAYFQANAAKYGLDDHRQVLRARRAKRDSKGSVHVRFNQYFDGVEVFEGEAIAHVDANGQVVVTDAIRKQIKAASKPRLKRAAAKTLAMDALNRPAESKINKAELEILPTG